MKVAGTFDPKELYYQRKNARTNSGFAAGESLDKSDSAYNEWFVPINCIPSHQSMKLAIK